MMSFADTMATCGIAAHGLHTTVQTFFTDTANIVVDDLCKYSFCFRLTFDTPHDTVGGMSISVPPDAHGDFETALLGGSGALVYVDDLDYSDVLRFTTAEEVCDEITRVMDIICIPDAVPAPEAPEETRTAPDGCLYTKAQFVAFYGRDTEWNDAAPSPFLPDLLPSPADASLSSSDDDDDDDE
jgi:hypothetical protein